MHGCSDIHTRLAPCNLLAAAARAGDNLTVPQTWEQFAELAERYHNGRDGLYGACIMAIGKQVRAEVPGDGLARRALGKGRCGEAGG